MKIVNGYATYAIYEVLTARFGGVAQDVIGAKLEEIVGEDAAATRLGEIRRGGKRAMMQYVGGVEDAHAIGRRNW